MMPQDVPIAEMDLYCLLYTSDAADDLLCVDLGGRRIIKKKKHKTYISQLYISSIQYSSSYSAILLNFILTHYYDSI